MDRRLHFQPCSVQGPVDYGKPDLAKEFPHCWTWWDGLGGTVDCRDPGSEVQAGLYSKVVSFWLYFVCFGFFKARVSFMSDWSQSCCSQDWHWTPDLPFSASQVEITGVSQHTWPEGNFVPRTPPPFYLLVIFFLVQFC